MDPIPVTQAVTPFVSLAGLSEEGLRVCEGYLVEREWGWSVVSRPDTKLELVVTKVLPDTVVTPKGTPGRLSSGPPWSRPLFPGPPRYANTVDQIFVLTVWGNLCGSLSTSCDSSSILIQQWKH